MRKTKLTYEMVDRAVALKKDSLCDADIIKALGVHKSTFYRWLKEGEDARTGSAKRELCDQLKAEVDYKKNLLVTIRNASMRPQHWTAAAWLLERKYPMEYGKMEHKAEEADNAVVVRRFSNTLRDSVYQQIQRAIEVLGLEGVFRCRVSPMEITYTLPGSASCSAGRTTRSSSRA